MPQGTHVLWAPCKHHEDLSRDISRAELGPNSTCFRAPHLPTELGWGAFLSSSGRLSSWCCLSFLGCPLTYAIISCFHSCSSSMSALWILMSCRGYKVEITQMGTLLPKTKAFTQNYHLENFRIGLDMWSQLLPFDRLQCPLNSLRYLIHKLERSNASYS